MRVDQTRLAGFLPIQNFPLVVWASESEVSAVDRGVVVLFIVLDASDTPQDSAT